ncbi:Scr1 family TA system antitoxin-like transcriptional regulator [Streptomyces sp. NPDC048484]|uniref:Scr1 family TA system antitoxin-like transcriptional regulator n=1 Tax=Streptomyces sp. NPDC048484 TaxID=3155146 RepID=UPI00341B0639
MYSTDGGRQPGISRPAAGSRPIAEYDHVSIRVIPFDAGSYPGSGQSVYFVCGSVPALDTAQLDQSHGPVFIDSEAQLGQYRQLLDRLEGAALDQAKSRDLVHDIARHA